MENYFLIEVSSDGTATTKAIYGYGTSKEAISAYHTTLASMMSNPNVKESMCMVINAYGAVVKSERYRAEEEPEE